MNSRIYNLKSQEYSRKNLRKHMTKAEIILWSKLKNKQLGFKFRRQFGVGRYIVDFCCRELGLIIEIDGGVHCYAEKIAADLKRQKYLEELGFNIVRYNNLDIIYNLQNAVDNLNEILKQNSPRLNPPLGKGRSGDK